MSKIFEALRQNSTARLEELLMESLDSQDAESGTAAPKGEQSRPAPVAHAAPIQAIQAPREQDASAGVRALPISVAASGPLFPFDVGENYPAEQYKIIRTKLVQHPRNPRMILITSAGPGDGKTVTAINLAASLSLKDDTKVLLIDGDFRRSNVHAQLSLPLSPGFTEVLAGQCTLEDALIRAEQFRNLSVLTAGERLPNAVELLDSERFRLLCNHLRKEFSYVIIDSTPISAVAEYHLLQAASDGTIMIARPDYTNRKLCLSRLETIPKDKLVGVVLNYVSDWFLSSRHDDYSYYYSEAR